MSAARSTAEQEYIYVLVSKYPTILREFQFWHAPWEFNANGPHQITVTRISDKWCKRQHDTCPSGCPAPFPSSLAQCVHVACICIFSNLASLAIAADFAKRYLPRAMGKGETDKEHTHTHMPLAGPPIYFASQVFSLWRVEWFQVFQLPCHRASETGRERDGEAERLCLFPSRLVSCKFV